MMCDLLLLVKLKGHRSGTPLYFYEYFLYHSTLDGTTAI